MLYPFQSHILRGWIRRFGTPRGYESSLSHNSCDTTGGQHNNHRRFIYFSDGERYMVDRAILGIVFGRVLVRYSGGHVVFLHEFVERRRGRNTTDSAARAGTSAVRRLGLFRNRTDIDVHRGIVFFVHATEIVTFSNRKYR